MRDRKAGIVAEIGIVNECLIALSGAGCLVWRNNTGALPDKGGRVMRFGLCRGSSDIIGVAPGGIFLAIEVKTATGRATPDQLRFIEAVVRSGGRAGLARSAEEAVAIARGTQNP